MSDGRDRDSIEFIQGLRGLAAAGVVLYHARVFIDGGRYLDLGTRLFGSGGAGVDLFFVISGFIMVHTTRQLAGGPRDALAFLARRFARIWPVYAVAFASMWLFTRLLTGPQWQVSLEDLGKTLAFYPLEPRSTAPFFGYPLLHVGWTLVYEAFFYGVFALALVTRRWRYLVLAAMFLGYLVVWPLAATGDWHADAMRGYRLHGYAAIATNPIVWDFAFGVLVGLLRAVDLGRFTIRDRGVLGCFVALAVGAVLWQLFSGYRHGHGPTRWGAPMAVMVLALMLYDKQYPIRVPGWMRWLGDISFSLYLFHVIPQMLPRAWKSEPQLTTGGGFFVASIVAGGVLAYISYRVLERGVSEKLRRWLLARIRA
ncbi:MAG TPA: acyltransferase [Kofleriaceae bacterium]|nr:acyltransferase [Kofleriaceae bacterium]